MIFYEPCPVCVRLHYRDLWECKRTIKKESTKRKLKELANELCKTCHGTGVLKNVV